MMRSCTLWFKCFVLLPFLVLGRGDACPMFEPPSDGILLCVMTSLGKVCSLACKTGFDFAESPALFYVCDIYRWSFVVFPSVAISLPWPNCAKRSTQSRIKSLGLKEYFYNGDASKLVTQTLIKKNFKALLNEPYSESRFCKDNPHCTDSNIEILYNNQTVHCQCYDKPVGIADGLIANSSFTASSYCSTYPPWNARLRGRGEMAWYAEPWDLKPWIQIDLGESTLASAVATQGKRFVYYVKTYKLAFSTDGKSWKTYKENDKEKVFQGNRDAFGVVMNYIEPVSNRLVRLYPLSWNNNVVLKLEPYTCKKYM